MKYLIYGMAIAALMSGCRQGDRLHTISDVTQAETITLEKLPEQGSIYSWKLEGSGEIEGKASITVMLGTEPYLTEDISGEIDFQWNGDWYADDATIVYKPISVTDGSLQLQYLFYD